ncbi:MAG: YhbY family RNA-binding protein [Candidatus Heimdallarchaeota archaeon]|nr:YhbY family RNA-binding protein [Candidatus Heimdallarchaeota archaeon]
MKEIFKQVLHGKPHIHVGRSGISDALIFQIHNHFKKKKIIKIKFLKIKDKDEIEFYSKLLANKAKAKILDIRGSTCIIQDISKQGNTQMK